MNFIQGKVPLLVYNSICRGWYTGDPKKKDGYSATELLETAKRLWLTRRHYDEITVMASAQLWALLGSAMHAILAKGATEDAIIEERLKIDVEGNIISGQADAYMRIVQPDGSIVGCLDDYKVTSVWTDIYGNRFPKWEKQLNIYRYLFLKHNYPVDVMRVIPLYRDWMKSGPKRYGNRYPVEPIETLEVPMMTSNEAYDFITYRANYLDTHKDMSDDEIPTCLQDERWQKPEKWAIHIGKKDRAYRTFNTETEAQEFIRQNPRKPLKSGKPAVPYTLHFRPSIPKRCVDYCNVNEWCGWYQDWRSKNEHLLKIEGGY